MNATTPILRDVLEQPLTGLSTWSAPSGTSDRDVIMCYQILLGRDPETSQVIFDHKQKPLRTVLRTFLTSSEFEKAVRRRVWSGLDPVRHDHAEPLSASQAAWLDEKLNLAEGTVSELFSSQDWGLFFRHLLSCEEVGRIAPELLDDNLDHAGPRIASEPRRRTTLGGISAWHDGRLIGWSLDVEDLTRKVALRVQRGSELVGTCICDEPRPELRRLFNGHDQFGFTVVLPPASRTDRAADDTIVAVDAETDAIVLGPIRVEHANQVRENGIADIRRRLAEIDSMIHSL